MIFMDIVVAWKRMLCQTSQFNLAINGFYMNYSVTFDEKLGYYFNISVT